MTKEEAIENIKLIRFNAAITNANSFKEALDMAIEALSKPSLPSDLDEAAEKAALKAYPEKVALNKKATGRYDANYPRRKAYQQGYEQAEKDLGWHSVKESLPPIDEEVIVLTDDIHGKIVPDLHYICYGHIVDKNIAVDYDGWNIPGVTHWMYCPKLGRKEQMIKKEPMKEDALDGEITYTAAYPHHEEVY